MYRSLCDRGSFTEYEYVLQIPNSRPLNYSQRNPPPPPAFRLSAPPRFPLGPSDSTMQCRGTNVYRPIQFASVTQSEGTRGSVFPPAGQTYLEFVRVGSTSSVRHECMQDQAN